MKKNLTTLLVLAAVLIVPMGATAQETYDIDSVHSTVMFKVKHFGIGYVYGRFNEFSGTVTFSEANPAASAVSMEIMTASVDSANAKRDQHLQSNDFFNAKRFPVITFKSSKVTNTDAGFVITGEMDFHGVKKTIEAPFEIVGSGKDPRGAMRVGGEAKFTISRSAFGVNYMPDGLSDDVEIIVALEAVKK